MNNSKTVVVAGGTGSTGRHIVDGIIATKKHTVKVFTRQGSSSSSDLATKGVQIVSVNYSDHASFVCLLQTILAIKLE
jgi:uncharacterized protein YbjT (DUF2867 family)